VWLNSHILAYKDKLIDNLSISVMYPYGDQQKQIFQFGFDEATFTICIRRLDRPESEDTLLWDMLLESQVRRQIRRLSIQSFNGQSALAFSSGAVASFFRINERLKMLDLWNIQMGDATCEVIGQNLRCVEALSLSGCGLNLQRFVNVLGANACALKAVALNSCTKLNGRESTINFSSIVVPLLKIPTTKAISLTFGLRASTRRSDVQLIKAALESKDCLEDFHIDGAVGIKHLNDLVSLLQGIAAAPNHRILRLQLFGNYSLQEQCESFAMALKDCKNNTLERAYMKLCKEDLWIREVAPILEFNIKRLCFQEIASGSSETERLMHALNMLAENTDNRHLCYWLVRNHAGALQRGKSAQVKSRRGKRHRYT
jgi:hypothetical protein